MPPIYYKYRPINFHTEQLLRNQEIYFSFGHEYNDPFDSKVRIDPSGSVEEVLATLEETPIPEDTKLFLRRKFKNNEINPELHLHSVYEVAKTTIMSSCFSSEPANVLMWSHYADSHKGICIGLANISDEKIPAIKFDLGNAPSNSLTLKDGVFPVFEVKYDRDEITIWKPYHDDITTFIDAHTNKAKYWEYEKEHRIVLAYKEYKTKVLRFDRRFLRELYLGARISVPGKTKVLEIVKDEYLNKNIPVRVFQTKISAKRFELDIEEIDMNNAF